MTRLADATDAAVETFYDNAMRAIADLNYRIEHPYTLGPATHTIGAPAMVSIEQAETLRAASFERLTAFLREHHIDAMTVIADSVHIGQQSLTFQRVATADDCNRLGWAGEVQTVHERIAITPEIAADLLGWTA